MQRLERTRAPVCLNVRQRRRQLREGDEAATRADRCNQCRDEFIRKLASSNADGALEIFEGFYGCRQFEQAEVAPFREILRCPE